MTTKKPIVIYDGILEELRQGDDIVGGTGTGGGDGTCCFLGEACDGDWSDGLFPFDPNTRVGCAVDDINEVLKYLAPGAPSDLSGTILPTITAYTGFLSQSPLNFNVWSPGDYRTNAILAAASFQTGSKLFGEADQGELHFYYNGSIVDTFDLAGNFNEIERGGGQSYPPIDSTNGYIHINSVQWFNSFPLWQQGSTLIQIGAGYGNADLLGGEFSYQLKHTIGPSSNDTTLMRYFYDPESGRPSISGTPTVVESAPVIKYLSGVQFYYTGSTFNVSTVANKAFEYTYVAAPVTISFPGVSTVSVLVEPAIDGAVSGVSSPPVWNEVMTITNKLITLNAVSQCDCDARVTINTQDPFGAGGSGQSISEQRMIDTYGITSTDVYEDFVDENRRLQPGAYNAIPGAITGQWTSSNLLSNGNAQVICCNGLIYPDTDYSSGYLPSQAADYSGFTGNQLYFRAFRHSGITHNSGRLDVTGIVSSDLNTNVKLEMKLPTQTGWLDLGTVFNDAIFTGADGDGCYTGPVSQSGSTLRINWTCGTFATVNSGYMYILRVTLLNGNKDISRIVEALWT